MVAFESHRPATRLLRVLALGLLASADLQEPCGPLELTRSAVGLQREGDALVGLGPHYKARFDERGVTFTPALGSAMPGGASARFELESIERDGAVLHGARPTAPERDGLRTLYRRAPGIVERWDVRTDGVELSLVLDERPAGTGPLVVRLRLASELPHATLRADGTLALERGDGAGVTVGPVLGIDALGRTEPGELRLAGDDRRRALELVLPASFVDSAAYPLVLDPLIGSALLTPPGLPGTGPADRLPDVAWDETNQVWLVVWERAFSATDVDVLGQRVSASATQLVGGLIAIESDPGTEVREPSVASVAASDRFLVVWAEGPPGARDVRARAVDAADGALSATVTVAGSAADEDEPDVGGVTTPGEREALVAYTNAGEAALRLVDVPAAGDPFAGTESVVSSFWISRRPSIAKSDGGVGRWLVAWDQTTFTGADLVLAAYERSFGLGPRTGYGAPGIHDTAAQIDGDGERWAVVHEVEPATGSAFTTGANFHVVFDGTRPVVTDSGNQIGRHAQVAYTGEAYLAPYTTNPVQETDIRVASIHPFLCLECEPVFSAAGADESEDWPSVASRLSGGGTGDEAAVAWQHQSHLHVGLLSSRAGSVTNLGGGCGAGGQARAACALVGNQFFMHELVGATPSAPAWLVLGFARLDVSCGPCTLAPDLAQSWILPTATDGDGRASVQTPVWPPNPALVGATIWDQWVVAPGSGCALLNVDLSNALEVVLE